MSSASSLKDRSRAALRFRAGLAALAIAAAAGVLVWLKCEPARPARSSQAAFEKTYLQPARGAFGTERRTCGECHQGPARDPAMWDALAAYSAASHETWASRISLVARCGSCHVVPHPATLPRQSWIESVARMARIMDIKGVPKLTEMERQEVLHYYFTFGPDDLPLLADDPKPEDSPVKFQRIALGHPANTTQREPPVLGRPRILDLDGDGALDLLVCDTDESRLNWLYQKEGRWVEETLARIPSPSSAHLLTNRGAIDIIVGCQKAIYPTDDLIGSVVLLERKGPVRFEARTLIANLPRVADVQPGDFDGDGNADILVAAHGHINVGEIGCLRSDGTNYSYEVILKRPGVIQLAPLDLNHDGYLDFVALFGQEHEHVSAFINNAGRQFQETILFKAATPSFGSSSIELVDLDTDGDRDILYTNGDNMDLGTMTPRPYHGVQWLENKGDLKFEWRDITRFYGAYCAVTGDINGDGRLDIVVTSMFNDWADPRRASIIWLENNGQQRFIAHAIDTQPISLIAAALGDLDGDGRLDTVVTGFHAFPPHDRRGRVTLWRNLGSR